MSPYKLSLIGPNDGDDRDDIELDDELVAKLKRVVDENPDLTLAEALRQGIIHVAENGPTSR
jgi:hypothetical protein